MRTLVLERGEPGASCTLGGAGHFSQVTWAGHFSQALVSSSSRLSWLTSKASSAFYRLRLLSQEKIVGNETHPKMPSSILGRYFGDAYALLCLGHVCGVLQISAHLLFLLAMKNSTAMSTPHLVPTFSKERKPAWQMHKCFRLLSLWWLSLTSNKIHYCFIRQLYLFS